MKKQEYIEKYGEESYKKMLQQRKEHYAKHKDEINEKRREFYGTHKDLFRESNKIYWYKNAEKLKDYKRKRYKENRDAVLAKQKKYDNTQNGRSKKMANAYKYEDRNNNRGECTITFEWIIDNIFTSKCIYCGDDNWQHLGADRIDNDKPHTESNVVCSCGICNCERQCKHMSVDEFIEYRKTHPRDIRESAIYGSVVENGVIKKIL